MAVTISNEELDIFNKNGFTDDDVQSTVNRYRSEGLDDNAIRAKVQERLNGWGYSQPTSKATTPKPTSPVAPKAPEPTTNINNPTPQPTTNVPKSNWLDNATTTIKSKVADFNKQLNDSKQKMNEDVKARAKENLRKRAEWEQKHPFISGIQKDYQLPTVFTGNKSYRGQVPQWELEAKYGLDIPAKEQIKGTAKTAGLDLVAPVNVGVEYATGGKGKLAKEGLKEAVKQGAKQLAKTGGIGGTVQGITSSLADNGISKDLLVRPLQYGTLGVLGGGAVGGLTPVLAKGGSNVVKAAGKVKNKIDDKVFDAITSTEAGTKALQAVENAKNAIGKELTKERTFKQAKQAKANAKQETFNPSMLEEAGSPVVVQRGINTPKANLTDVPEAPVVSRATSNIEIPQGTGPVEKQRGGLKTLQKWFGKKNTEGVTNTTYTTRPREVLQQEASALTDEARLNAINKVDGVTDTDLYVKAENIKNAFDNGQIPIKAMDNWLEVGTKKGQELQGMNALGNTPVNAALAMHKGFQEGAPKAKALKEQADKLIEAFYNKDKKAIDEILRKAKIKTKNSKNLIDDLDNLSQNNMLTKEEVENVINKRFGIGEVTTEDFKNLTSMYDNLNSLDKNSYEYQLQESLIGKYIADRLPVSWQQKVKTLRNILWLLNFKTAERNILGNLFFNAVEKLVTDPTATLVDKVLAIQTGERSRVLPQLKEYMVGGIQGFKRAKNEVDLGVNSRLKAGLQSFRDMGNRTFKKFSKQDIKQAKQNANNVLEGLATEAKMKSENFAHGLEKALAYELQVPDRTFFEATYEESLRNQILAAGEKVTNEQIEAFRKIAEEEALESVFQNNSRLANAMNDAKKFLNFKRELGMGDLSIPYIQTPANIAQQRINYSPVGLVHNLKKWKNRDITQRQASKGIARGLVGTAGYGATGAGLITGGVKINEKAKEYGKKYKTRKAMGKMDQSLETPDGSMNIGYGNLGTITDIIDMYNSYDNAYNKIKDYKYKKDIDKFKNAEGFEDKANALLPMAKNTAEAVLEPVKTSFDPVLDMLDDSFKYKDILEHKSLLGVIDHAAGQAVRGMTPSSLRDFAKATDKYERTTKTTSDIGTALNELRAAIPGLRQTLPVRNNAAGQPEKTKGWANELLNPIKISKVSKDKILNAIDTLGETDSTFYLPAVTNKVTFKQGNEEVTKELNSKQLADYQRRLGQMALTYRYRLLDGKDPSNMSEFERNEIARQIRNFDSAAKQVIASDMFEANAPNVLRKGKTSVSINKQKLGNIGIAQNLYNKVKQQEEKQAAKEKRTRLEKRVRGK